MMLLKKLVRKILEKILYCDDRPWYCYEVDRLALARNYYILDLYKEYRSICYVAYVMKMPESAVKAILKFYEAY